jgi:hypothetical protein
MSQTGWPIGPNEAAIRAVMAVQAAQLFPLADDLDINVASWFGEGYEHPEELA